MKSFIIQYFSIRIIEKYKRISKYSMARILGANPRMGKTRRHRKSTDEPNDFSHKPTDDPARARATCSDSDEPSANPVVLQLVKRFPRHRIRSAILDRGERGARFSSLCTRQYSTRVREYPDCCRTEKTGKYFSEIFVIKYVRIGMHFNRTSASREA